MIHNRDVAKRVSELMLDCSTRLNESITLVRDECDPEEFKAYRLAVGKVMAEILLEALNPLFEVHPELKPPGWDVELR